MRPQSNLGVSSKRNSLGTRAASSFAQPPFLCAHPGRRVLDDLDRLGDLLFDPRYAGGNHVREPSYSSRQNYRLQDALPFLNTLFALAHVVDVTSILTD